MMTPAVRKVVGPKVQRQVEDTFSNYNFRARAAEVLVDGQAFQTVRRRETFEDLIRLESE